MNLSTRAVQPDAAIRIAHLVDEPHLSPVLRQWFVAEWAAWYGPGGEGNAAADLAACADRETLPLCVAALDSQGEPLGTASLKADGLGDDLAPGPWLGALLVHPSRRRRGVADVLVEAMEGEARRLGFDALYTATDMARTVIERRGWLSIGDTRSLCASVGVYKLSLTARLLRETS